MCAQKFSLSFSKTIEKKSLQPSAIRNDAPAEIKERTETLESIEENVLKTDGKTEETELVIPLMQVNRAAVYQKLVEKLKASKSNEENNEEVMNTATEEDKTKKEPRVLTLDEQAEAALLEESKRRLDTWNERGANDNLTILSQVEEKLDTSPNDLGKESSLDDYDQVDVSVYGAAILRGMGWKKSEGVGRGNKKVVEIINPSSKSFGLAGKKPEIPIVEGKGVTQEEELTLMKGSYVFIHSGRHRGTYGVVETLDEDHLLVKAAVSQTVIREVELNVRVVSQNEFKDSSRVINKDMYDKFKEEEAKTKEKLKKMVKDSEPKPDNTTALQRGLKLEKMAKEEITPTNKDKVVKKPSHPSKEVELKMELKRETQDTEKTSKHRNERKYREYEGKKSKNDPKRCDEKSEVKLGLDSYGEKYQSEYTKKSVDKNDVLKNHSQKHSNHSQSSYYNSKSKVGKREYEDEYDSYSQGCVKVQKSQSKMPAIPWVQENLRVRLISKSYKGGRYHKEKVIVQNVETAESCECITEEGKMLRQVHPAWLETVIPKVHPQIVMVVKGPQKGQKGLILQLHKDQEKASIQLLEDETVIIKLHYDDICEYVRR
ncbi:G-patch domain and KOW motifs-containing protein [Procambarus clarkii]|uniref:G-patch domain and KOW motifs-containing protein n=1 Tax=Procambarus clarkii TaxID=6728 RepID=UPI001E678689|nr:G-patch domain and KOW motifs-containing protein-like [Procambarus clarkii]